MAIRWKVGKEPMIPQPEQQALPYCVKLATRLTVYKNSTSGADGSIDCSVLATISSHAFGLKMLQKVNAGWRPALRATCHKVSRVGRLRNENFPKSRLGPLSRPMRAMRDKQIHECYRYSVVEGYRKQKQLFREA